MNLKEAIEEPWSKCHIRMFVSREPEINILGSW